MASEGVSQHSARTKSNWVYYLLILLVIEKIIQHVLVTLAFYFNWANIASTVAVAPRILMILGAIVAILFALSLWGMIRKKTWAINLVIGLAWLDILGELVAQGQVCILINVSFVVAMLLLILGLSYRRRLHLMTFS